MGRTVSYTVWGMDWRDFTAATALLVMVQTLAAGTKFNKHDHVYSMGNVLRLKQGSHQDTISKGSLKIIIIQLSLYV